MAIWKLVLQNVANRQCIKTAINSFRRSTVENKSGIKTVLHLLKYNYKQERPKSQ